jgi:tetratricopeptide (TPR) repeat protein
VAGEGEGTRPGVPPPSDPSDPAKPREPADPSDAASAPTAPLDDTDRRRPLGPALAAGEVVSGRYRVVRFLAAGGAGEVYEAEDLELGARVALKTVTPTTGSRAHQLERFRREILLARKVTHPNACRIYDVGQQRRDDGPPVFFLTMELLPGPTLAERLAEDGPLAPSAALPLARQIAAALDAAHAAGIVHRDLKSANVMLVPDASSPGGVRAVVTDFGLARARGDDQALAAAVTAPGVIVGTPAYMAPEQVAGGEASASSDVYSFGIVLYEMVTGKVPFSGSSPLSTAVKRLHEPPPSPRLHAPQLDARWERVILRALERDPAERFARAGDLVAALAAPPGRAGGAARRWRTAALVAGGALAAALPWLLARARERPAAVVLPAARPAVAVLGLRNLSGRADEEWLSTALGEMLTTELTAGERLRAVPGETVARAELELGLRGADSLAAPTLGRMRALLGADYLVLGSYVALPEASGTRLRLDLRLQEFDGGPPQSIAVVGEQNRLFELVARAGGELRRRLGLGELSPVEAGELRAARPQSPEAARLYAEGLARLRLFDALAARRLLERAVEEDPDYPLAHAALAEAWQKLGYDGRARAAAERAFELSTALPRSARILVEARFHESANEWSAAARLYASLVTFYPDNLDHGLRLAEAQIRAGEAELALATVERLRSLPAPAGEDPAIDLAEAAAARALSDFARHHQAASRAVAKGEALGAGLLVARARLEQGQADFSLGRAAEAAAAYADAERRFRAAGDLAGAARAWRWQAALRRSRGDLDGARAAAEQALSTLERIGDQAGTAMALNTLANVLYQQGRLADAAARYEQALAVCREIGDERSLAAALGNLANVRFLQGDLLAAIRSHEEALALKRRRGDRGGVATSLVGLGSALWWHGDLDAAERAQREALELARSTGQKSLAAHALYGLGELLAQRDQLQAARAAHEEALALRTELGELGAAAESRLALATIAVLEGRPAEAESPARRAAREFAAEEEPDGGALAEALLVRALLGRGETAGARLAAERSRALARRSENPATRLLAELSWARVLAATTQTGEARRVLDGVEAAAEAGGLLPLVFEARLLAGVIGVGEAGDAATPQARERLQALAEEAAARGFALIARQARAAF